MRLHPPASYDDQYEYVVGKIKISQAQEGAANRIADQTDLAHGAQCRRPVYFRASRIFSEPSGPVPGQAPHGQK